MRSDSFHKYKLAVNFAKRYSSIKQVPVEIYGDVNNNKYRSFFCVTGDLDVNHVKNVLGYEHMATIRPQLLIPFPD